MNDSRFAADGGVSGSQPTGSLFAFEQSQNVALPSVALIEAAHGPMSRGCDVCRGGWWDSDDEVLIRVHHNECPRKDDE